MKKSILSLTVVLSTFTASAFAQGTELLCSKTTGTSAVELSLSASASSEIVNDRIVLSLAYDVKAESGALASSRASDVLNKKVAELKLLPGLKKLTSSINTYQDYQTKRWIGQAQITIELIHDTSKPRALSLEPFAVTNTSYSASNAARDQKRKELYSAVVKELNAKARMLTAALGKGSFELVRLNVNDDFSFNARPQVAMALMKGMAADSAPVSTGGLEGGDSTITVTANGVICVVGK